MIDAIPSLSVVAVAVVMIFLFGMLIGVVIGAHVDRKHVPEAKPRVHEKVL